MGAYPGYAPKVVLLTGGSSHWNNYTGGVG